MATAVIAGISAFAALAPLIKPIVLQIENLFGKGTGPTKLATAAGMVQVASDQLAKAGTITSLPTIEQITALVQGTVDDMKARGLLNGPAPVTVTAGNTVVAGPPVVVAGNVSSVMQVVASLLQTAAQLIQLQPQK